MAIKTILVPLGDPEAGAAPLQTAFAVAELFDAHVEALHVRADPRNAIVDYVGESMPGHLFEDVLKAAEARATEVAERVRKLFDDACARAGIAIAEAAPGPGKVSAAWREETGYEDQWVERYGRLADLTVIGRPSADEDAASRLSIESAILGTGRSLLVAPPKAPESVGNNVAIAWNGSAEAARGVGAAMPFLTRAGAVTVLSVDAHAGRRHKPEDLAAYLAWHGIKAKAATIPAKNEPVGATLLMQAARGGADLMVMGAYTHSRVREMIVGGVTRHVLGSTELAVLMAL